MPRTRLRHPDQGAIVRDRRKSKQDCAGVANVGVFVETFLSGQGRHGEVESEVRRSYIRAFASQEVVKLAHMALIEIFKGGQRSRHFDFLARSCDARTDFLAASTRPPKMWSSSSSLRRTILRQYPGTEPRTGIFEPDRA
ncbi:hypothetical protein SELMODRAFT_412399 [Selaginella moellendorffii]|uniref:Uncharacterized protein n=1 Tax=Selaginella moellendorffii TaxID=88036 RepID=D8RL14_SELML|nr:hypothetical protein SELMODRAFT_412399 [Selaginella moellendorffii]